MRRMDGRRQSLAGWYHVVVGLAALLLVVAALSVTDRDAGLEAGMTRLAAEVGQVRASVDETCRALTALARRLAYEAPPCGAPSESTANAADETPGGGVRLDELRETVSRVEGTTRDVCTRMLEWSRRLGVPAPDCIHGPSAP